MAFKIKGYWRLLKESAIDFNDDNALKLCASLAYYTVFSIGPLLLVIISLTGLFFETNTVTYRVYGQMVSLLGKQGADQILSIITELRHQNAAAKFSFIGLIILLVGATSVFAEIQDSINFIWSIRAKPKRGWLKYLKNRLLSFSLIVGIGFILIVSLLVNAVADALTDRLQRLFADVGVLIFKGVNIMLVYVVVTTMFAVIYKVLPDARIKWKDAFIGASFTGILFLVGKLLITFYLSTSQLASTYGAAAAVIILLSWVYYSAMILYFGAEFTKTYAREFGGGIEPYETAVFIIKQEAKELPTPVINEATEKK